MAEDSVGTYPQVFVVDSQANYLSAPSEKKTTWVRVGQKILLLLLALTMFGLVIEGYLIYNLYKRTEAFSTCKFHSLCQNTSSSKTSSQQGGPMTQVGHEESNEIPTAPPHPENIQQRPFAQLIGSSQPAGKGNVVQWEHKFGESVTRHMNYSDGRLLVEIEGHYYLYSKVTLNAEDCSFTQHKVMKATKAYGEPIELLKSNSNRCRIMRSTKPTGGYDVWNSFLAGIFHLQSGDEIYTTLEDIQKMHQGTTENLMGAFMVAP